jgi:hypothetical protein
MLSIEITTDAMEVRLELESRSSSFLALPPEQQEALWKHARHFVDAVGAASQGLAPRRPRRVIIPEQASSDG